MRNAMLPDEEKKPFPGLLLSYDLFEGHASIELRDGELGASD